MSLIDIAATTSAQALKPLPLHYHCHLTPPFCFCHDHHFSACFTHQIMFVIVPTGRLFYTDVADSISKQSPDFVIAPSNHQYQHTTIIVATGATKIIPA